MYGSLALIMALSAVSAEHKASRVRSPLPTSHYSAQYDSGEIFEPAPTAECTHGDCCVEPGYEHGCAPDLFWCCRGTCNMYPVVQYYPEAHGYYYFRPYNWVHVAPQQAFAASFGQDPRNPYSNEFFQRIYQDVEARYIEPIVPSALEDERAPVPPPALNYRAKDAPSVTIFEPNEPVIRPAKSRRSRSIIPIAMRKRF